MSMDYMVFMVNDEPYCIWDYDLDGMNRNFLLGMDPEYFHYVLQLNESAKDSQRAAVALRINLHHALETLFSLIGAFVQAPDCVFGWLAKCQTSDLRKVIGRIHEGDRTLFTKFNCDEMNWSVVAAYVLKNHPHADRRDLLVKEFSGFLSRLFVEFLDKNRSDEFNAIKHGFRVNAGGFALHIATTEDMPKNEEDWVPLGGSRFGSTFYSVEPILGKKDRSLKVDRISNNWSMEQVGLLCKLTYISIVNVLSGIKIANGIDPKECNFIFPANLNDFNIPWEISVGVKSARMSNRADEANTKSLTKEEVTKILSNNH